MINLFNKVDKDSQLYKTRTDIMRYKNNSISFLFCILAIVFNVLMFFVIYHNNNCTSNFELGIDALLNVCLMLGIFLLSEKTKSYNKNGAFIAIGFGVIQIARIFWIPLKYFLANIEYQKALAVAGEGPFTYSGIIGMNQGDFTLCVIYLSLSAICLIIAGLVAYFKGERLRAHIAEIEKEAKEASKAGK